MMRAAVATLAVCLLLAGCQVPVAEDGADAPGDGPGDAAGVGGPSGTASPPPGGSRPPPPP